MKFIWWNHPKLTLNLNWIELEQCMNQLGCLLNKYFLLISRYLKDVCWMDIWVLSQNKSLRRQFERAWCKVNNKLDIYKFYRCFPNPCICARCNNSNSLIIKGTGQSVWILLFGKKKEWGFLSVLWHSKLCLWLIYPNLVSLFRSPRIRFIK